MKKTEKEKVEVTILRGDASEVKRDTVDLVMIDKEEISGADNSFIYGYKDKWKIRLRADYYVSVRRARKEKNKNSRMG